MLEVDQFDVGKLLAREFVGIDLSAIEQLEHRLIRFDEAAAWQTGDLVEQFVELFVGQPRTAIRCRVDRPHAVPKQLGEDDFSKARSET